MQLLVKLVKNSTKNLFRRKETTNEVPRKIFRLFEVRKKVRLNC